MIIPCPKLDPSHPPQSVWPYFVASGAAAELHAEVESLRARLSAAVESQMTFGDEKSWREKWAEDRIGLEAGRCKLEPARQSASNHLAN
jgi:hypothetical protein